MSAFEVEQPKLNGPFAEPAEHWLIEEGPEPKRATGRRPAGYFYRDPKLPRPEPGAPARGAWQELAPRACRAGSHRRLDAHPFAAGEQRRIAVR